uniref:SGNH hydrolase-type esterase domain-containing protein n=1 Tax=Fagus sylvatica TaxID=28930 RepID=A0A2N9J3F8_FAGSY
MKFPSSKPLSCSSIIIFSIVVFNIFHNSGSTTSLLPKNETVPAFIVFGDSIVDTGNNNYIDTLVKCDFRPYGRDFIGGKPTGRFCNGKVTSDFLAEAFGVKKILPAYLDPNLQLQDLLTGVSFASGGAGYDPLTAKIVELYELGARRIGVLSLPAIGCVPSQRTLADGIQRGCSKSANQAAILFNSKLSSQMDSLNNRLPDARLVYLDIYNPLLALIQNPAHYGFQVANRGCCGTGNIEVSILCNHFSPHTCTNASEYVFWDSYHPSEQAYKILTSLVLKKYINKFF